MCRAIDDLDIFRAGSTGRVLAHKVMAPSTVGTWLCSLTFGHVLQLGKVSEQLLTRSWQLGAGPVGGEVKVDIDLTPILEDHPTDIDSRSPIPNRNGGFWLRLAAPGSVPISRYP